MAIGREAPLAYLLYVANQGGRAEHEAGGSAHRVVGLYWNVHGLAVHAANSVSSQLQAATAKVSKAGSTSDEQAASPRCSARADSGTFARV